MLIRIMAPLLALISLFIFPWQASLLFVFGASLLMPPAGLALGIVADLVYYTPGASFMPYFSLFGAGCFGVSILVHRFVKTRIMD